MESSAALLLAEVQPAIEGNREYPEKQERPHHTESLCITDRESPDNDTEDSDRSDDEVSPANPLNKSAHVVPCISLCGSNLGERY